jgi:hypothetical protein
VEELQIETTVYSMSVEPPAEPDRRADERRLTLFRVASIVVGNHRELCLVKNISAGGAVIRPYRALETGAAIEVELKEGQPAGGCVTWARGSDCGITFDRPVDVLDLLKTAGDGPRPRMPRIEFSCVAFVREGAVVHRCLVHNVSQGGLSVEAANALTVGADVTVSLSGLPAQGSVVRWQDGKRYGITFNNVLPLAGLVEWLQARRGP